MLVVHGSELPPEAYEGIEAVFKECHPIFEIVHDCDRGADSDEENVATSRHCCSFFAGILILLPLLPNSCGR